MTRYPINIVSGQITSSTLQKLRWDIFNENLTLFFLFLKAVVNIPIQTHIISPLLLFRNKIISQLELGRPVEAEKKLIQYKLWRLDTEYFSESQDQNIISQSFPFFWNLWLWGKKWWNAFSKSQTRNTEMCFQLHHL